MSTPSHFTFELKQLLHLMIPILVTQFAQAGFGLIDTIMAGQLSAADLAAVAVAVGIWMPVMLLCSGIMLATSPLIAAALGAKKTDEIPTISHQALWIALFLGLVGMMVLHVMPQFFHLLKVPENLHAKAGLFLHTIAFGIPAITLYTVLRCYVEALGHPRVVTTISLLALPILVPLNYVFMHGLFGLPAMGSAGCGVANAILQWLMLIVLFFYIKHAKSFAHVRLFERFEKESRFKQSEAYSDAEKLRLQSCCHAIHQYLKEIGMLLFPAFTGFLQLPAIDDITIQNQSIAIYVLEKTGDLLRPGMFRSQMDVREDNSRIVLS